jgi:hypothetical protein
MDGGMDGWMGASYVMLFMCVARFSGFCEIVALSGGV